MLKLRDAVDADHEPIIAVTVRAWEPVYAAVNTLLGRELAMLLHGQDWREHQVREVRAILAAGTAQTWVAELDGVVVGFTAARVVDADRRIGEVVIVGVDPDAQRRGVGTLLTKHATAWLGDQAMRVAYLGTGGDPGHAPARLLYESLGFRRFPIAQYYKAL
jgi:GNAT superfamily N-acetyltransferase